MKHIKRIFLSLLVAASAGTAFATGQMVAIIDKDGNRQEFVITRVEKISLGATELTVEQNDGAAPTTVAYTDVDRILIGVEAAAIKDMTSDGSIAVWPTVTDGTVNVAGAQPGAPIRAYTVGGALVTECAASERGDATVNISDAPAGICILTIGSHSVKIIKK